MARVATNAINLGYIRESSIGVIPANPAFKNLEPNTIGAFGATIETVARQPISSDRQRRQGSIVSVSSAVDFEADLTRDSLRDFIGGFLLASVLNRDITELTVDAVVATGATAGYTLATALVAAQSGKLHSGGLVWASGFGTANDGLKVLSNDAGNNTRIPVAGLTASTAAATPDDARVSFAGHRLTMTTAPAWDNTNKRLTLTVGVDLTDRLFPGQIVHLGSVATLGAVLDNGIVATGNPNVELYGYARVRSVAATSIVLDKVEFASSISGATTFAANNTTDLVFGEFIRNVATSHDDFDEHSFAFEAHFPGLDTGATDTEYQYARGNYCNSLALALALDALSTIAPTFIGTDADAPTTRRTGATGVDPLFTTGYSSTADVARLRIAKIDESGLATDFKNATITLNNNVSPERVVGKLEPAFINIGNFEVNLEAQAIFTDGGVIAAIRDNLRVSLDFVVSNADGVIAVDIPSMTLGGGNRDFPVNESVLVNATGQAFRDPDLETSIGVSLIPVPIPE